MMISATGTMVSRRFTASCKLRNSPTQSSRYPGSSRTSRSISACASCTALAGSRPRTEKRTGT